MKEYEILVELSEKWYDWCTDFQLQFGKFRVEGELENMKIVIEE